MCVEVAPDMSKVISVKYPCSSIFIPRLGDNGVFDINMLVRNYANAFDRYHIPYCISEAF